MHKTTLIMAALLSTAAYANVDHEVPEADRSDRISTASNPNMAARSMSFTVPDMSCAGCEARVKSAVRKVAGVRAVTADAKRKEVSFTLDPSKPADQAAVIKAIEDEGFTVTR